MYCSTRGSIVASRAKPECCNTAPSAAIHASILNTWNSNYKYLYFIFLLIQKNERIFWFFFKYFLQIKCILSYSTYFFNLMKYVNLRICALGGLHQNAVLANLSYFTKKSYYGAINNSNLIQMKNWQKLHSLMQFP